MYFQAAGPTVASIQSSVDAFRAALGEPNNGNAPGPLEMGRREINWDGGGNNDTTDGSLSFFDILFDEARIARVKITTGDEPPGPDDDNKRDIVMMDDFIYGEPQPH